MREFPSRNYGDRMANIQTYKVSDTIDVNEKIFDSASDVSDEVYTRCQSTPVGVLKVIKIEVDEMDEEEFRDLEDA